MQSRQCRKKYPSPEFWKPEESNHYIYEYLFIYLIIYLVI